MHYRFIVRDPKMNVYIGGSKCNILKKFWLLMMMKIL